MSEQFERKIESETRYKIRDFSEFLEKCLKQKVLDYSLKPLTKPGDNYGSVMLSVEVKVAAEDHFDKTDTLHFVAKTAATNPYLVQLFLPNVTFVKEAHFYANVIPAMEHFQQISNIPKKERLDAFIRCHGSRLSINPSAEYADADAVMLFENVKLLSFRNTDQRLGFDTDESLAILQQLAKFHSICIAMKRQSPELFNTKIRPFTNDIYVGTNHNRSGMIQNIRDGIKYIENINAELRENIETSLEAGRLSKVVNLTAVDNAYTTVIHKYFWSTNVMIKKNKLIEVKIYDFQMYRLDSFACDLVLFLFTSIRPQNLVDNFKLFVQFYHVEFIKMLVYMNFPVKDYAFEKMWQEIEKTAKISLTFILYIVKIIHIQGDAPSSYDEVPQNMFLREGKPSDDTLTR